MLNVLLDIVISKENKKGKKKKSAKAEKAKQTPEEKNMPSA